MEKTTKVRITKTRKRTINLSISAQRAFCHDCQREVQILTTRQTLELLETSKPRLEELLVFGEVHAVANVVGGLWICADSLNA